MALSNRAGRCLFFSGREEARTATAKHFVFSAELEESFPFVKGYMLAKNQTKESFASNLPGEYNYENIVVASAVASYFKVPLKQIARAVGKYTPTNSRSEIKKFGASKVLFDAYNANPDSVAAALTWISSRPEKQKVVVLGELAELGAYAKTEHTKAANAAQEIEGCKVAFFGAAYEGVSNDCPIFTDIGPLRRWLAQFLEKSDTVILLKGSRSNRLERVLPT